MPEEVSETLQIPLVSSSHNSFILELIKLDTWIKNYEQKRNNSMLISYYTISYKNV